MAKAKFSKETQILLVVPEAGQPANPKRVGSASHPIFELYFTSRTVGDFLAAGGRRADIIWDLARGYILLDQEGVDTPAPESVEATVAKGKYHAGVARKPAAKEKTPAAVKVPATKRAPAKAVVSPFAALGV